MNIKEQTDFIIGHPGFVDSVRRFNGGDIEGMRDVIYGLQLHCIDVQIKNSAKEFGLCKRMNGSDIKEALLGLKQPCNLDFRIAIPMPYAPVVQECRVVDFVPHINKKAARYFNPLQLIINFPISQFSMAATY